MKSIKDTLSLFMYALLGFFIQFGLGIFLARHLTEALYGDYNIAIKILNVLVMLSLYGTNVSADRFLAKYIETHQSKRSIKYLAWNIKLLTVTFVISLIIALIAFGIMWGLHYFKIQHIDQYHLAVYSLWLVPFLSIFILINSFLISSQRAQIATFYTNILSYTIKLGLFFLVVIYFDPMLNNTSIILVLFLASILLSVIASFSINRDLLSMLYHGIKQLQVTSISEKKWVKTAMRLMLNNVLHTMICAIDLLAVELITKHEASTGYYAAALIITNILWLIPDSTYQALKSQLSVLLADKSKKHILQKKLNTVNLIALCLIVIVSSVLIYFETNLLRFFGPTYTQGKALVVILTIGYAIGCYARISTILLTIGGYERIVLKGTVFELIAMIVLLIPGTYYYGAIGTAVVTSFVIACRGCTNIYFARKKFGLKPTYFI